MDENEPMVLVDMSIGAKLIVFIPIVQSKKLLSGLKESYGFDGEE